MASGHALSEVRKYTPRQLFAFGTLLNKRQKGMDQNFMALTRMAYHAEAKEFQKIVKSIESPP